MEENKVFVSEEEAIEQLEKIDEEIKKNKKHHKKIKEAKPKKPKYMKSSKKDKKPLIIVCVIVVIILIISLIAGALFFYFEQSNLKKIEDSIKKASSEYYNNVKDDFNGIDIIIKNGKIQGDDILKLKDLPDEAVINIDEDGIISYAIKSKNYCAVKNAYDEKSSIKYSKKCKLRETASEYIIKNNKDFIKDDESTNYNKDLDYGSKYYVEGKNPNNYIVIANRCFRIINIANNGNIKAIYDGYYDEKGCSNTSGGYAMIERTNFGDSNNNIYNSENKINSLLTDYVSNKTMNDKITFSDLDMEKIANAKWYVGAVNINTSISDTIKNEQTNRGKTALDAQENNYEFVSKIGLINVSDFLKASKNEKCVGMTSAYSNPEYDCNKENYLYLDGYPTWTLNAYSESNNRAWRISAMGSLIPVLVSNENAYVRPVIYIKGNTNVTGNGTKVNPYIVI